MPKSKSSKRWLKEHFADQFVKQAQAENLRSRAAFKLLALQEKDKIFKPGMTVVDLGAAPGGWTQVIKQFVGKSGRVVAIDILFMEALPDVEIIQGDFTQAQVFEALQSRLKTPHSVDVIVSDMAPNITGIASVDQPKAMYLAEIALDAAESLLKEGGIFVVKVFQGVGFDKFLQDIRQKFLKVNIRKPAASRARSKEVYLVARGYKV